MNRPVLIFVCIALGAIGSSFIWTIVLHEHEMGHRNFEYVQCEQFYELAEIIGYEQDFDCNWILKLGVLKFELQSNSSLERERIKSYPYGEYAAKYAKGRVGE